MQLCLLWTRSQWQYGRFFVVAFVFFSKFFLKTKDRALNAVVERCILEKTVFSKGLFREIVEIRLI